MIDRIGNYRITDEIGSGGMAVVYKGVQEPLGRVVAIKALKTVLSEDQQVVARFHREALSVASFQHENIITLYDFFRDRGALFMVMEYVEGIDLYDLLEKCRPFPTDVAVIVALQVARALEYAHFRGVIHRDVKPANVIVSRLGEVKLTDFGIARTEQSDLTEAGLGLGTPAYMAPEQVVGDKLDHRCDIWSLGVLMYQMVTGRKPFIEDENHSVLQLIRTQEPISPRKLNEDVKRELERIIFKCLKKSPEDRYDSTLDLVITLEQYLATHVEQNYRARVVTFLREQNVISADETRAMLHPALIGSQLDRSGKVVTKRKTPRRWVWATLGATVGLGSAIGAQQVYTKYIRTKPPTPKMQLTTTSAVEESVVYGALRILAHPWARIEIDGDIVATTPLDQPIALKPGKYLVKLINPYFLPSSHEVVITAGKTETITAMLKTQAGP